MSLDDFDLGIPTINTRASKRNIVFEVLPVKMEAESEAHGRPIHKDVDFVRITNPGSRDEFVSMAEKFCKQNPNDREVRERYLAWKESEKKNKITGTPLSALTFMSKSDVADLNCLNIFSVEQLIDLPESAHHRIMGAKTMIAKATAYLQAAKDQSYVTKMAADLEERDHRIDLLERTVKELGDRLEIAEKRARK
jgi:hypothetical protein